MSKRVEMAETVRLLRSWDNIVILMHKNPDGDTLGSGYALCAALRTIGKNANTRCSHTISERYDYMTDMEDLSFDPQVYIAVDTADVKLLGSYEKECVRLCIDHHGSNSGYADYLWCNASSASCAELIAPLIDELGVPFNRYIAQCLYTGLTTDTGCFRYSNTTAGSLCLGARLLDCGIDAVELNNRLFEVKSRGRFELEQCAMAGIEFTLNGQIAFMTITQDMLLSTGIDAGDIEGVTAIPKNIEGVRVGVTLRELQNKNYKISLRTTDIDAAEVASLFGGGGHARAAGFEVSGTLYDIKVALVAALEKLL